ncbi:MAG: hypothetical protein AAF845_05640 [Bacteroidota bacterium]
MSAYETERDAYRAAGHAYADACRLADAEVYGTECPDAVLAEIRRAEAAQREGTTR